MASLLMVGGCGALGTMLLPQLAMRHDVTVLDLRKPAAPVRGVSYHVGDVRDHDLVTGLAYGADSLVYMAMGPNSGWGTPRTARQHLDTAVTGLYLALSAANAAGVQHAVYTSSMSVYRYLLPGTDRLADRNQVGRLPDETVPPDATDFYGLAKRLGEEVCANAAQEWGMDTVCLRLCFPTADADWPRRSSVYEQITCTAASDVVAALECALAYRGHGFDAFAISGDRAGRVLSLAKAERRLGWRPLRHIAAAHERYGSSRTA